MTNFFKIFFTDVISISRIGQHFRMIYDVKGRFTVHRISAEEAKVKFLLMCKRKSLFLYNF